MTDLEDYQKHVIEVLTGENGDFSRNDLINDLRNYQKATQRTG